MKFNIQKHFYSTKCTTSHGLGEKADLFYKCKKIFINYLSTPLSIKPKFKCFRCFVLFGIIYQLVDNDETVAQVREDFVLKHLLIHSFVCGSFIHSSIHPFIDSAFFLTKSILHPISHQLQNYIF